MNPTLPSVNDNRDKMTGLPSPRAGRAIIEGSIGHNGRVALLLCDIDRFKVFNDARGREAGDSHLRRMAHTLKKVATPFPVFRWGSDEFGVVIQERSLEQVREIAAQILESQKPVLISIAGQLDVETLTLSIGIALFPDHAFNGESLLEAASIALLKAKEGGRLADGTPYTGRNRAMAWGDFLDEFPDESRRFLNPDFMVPPI